MSTENLFKPSNRKDCRGVVLADILESVGMCKMGLTGLHDSYGSWHLYICRFLFGLSTFLSLRIICVIRRKKSR